MNSIILHDFEVNKLQKDGVVQIRRIMKVQPPYLNCKGGLLLDTTRGEDKKHIGKCFWITEGENQYFTCPFEVGKEYVVKETWCRVTRLNDCCGKHSNLCGGIDSWDYYKAENKKLPNGFVWKSPVTMPREASRFTIVFDDIWSEPLQSIDWLGMTESGFTAIEQFEGCFSQVWDEHNKFKWSNNPHVWVGRARKI